MRGAQLFDRFCRLIERDREDDLRRFSRNLARCYIGGTAERRGRYRMIKPQDSAINRSFREILPVSSQQGKNHLVMEASLSKFIFS